MVISTIPNRPVREKSVDQSIFADMDRHRRRWFGWHSFGCLFLLLVIVVLSGGVAVVAATGIVTVPGVSPLVYDPVPTPDRIVDPSSFDVTKTVKLSESVGTAEITEAQLTSLVSADRLTMFRQAELMADPEGLTFFGQYIKLPVGNPVIIQLTLVPTVSSGGTLDCTVTKLTLGRLPVPPTLITSLGLLLCGNLSGAIVPPGMTLSSLQLTTGKLILSYSTTEKTSTLPLP